MKIICFTKLCDEEKENRMSKMFNGNLKTLIVTKLKNQGCSTNTFIILYIFIFIHINHCFKNITAREL